jgi:aryl-alcohol dehydrogenase-like predicted oxidoreductase
MKSIALPSGERVPALGQGTWNMGDDASTRAEEIAALRMGLDHGLTLIDTAEMYGNGRSEELVAEAVGGSWSPKPLAAAAMKCSS